MAAATLLQCVWFGALNDAAGCPFSTQTHARPSAQAAPNIDRIDGRISCDCAINDAQARVCVQTALILNDSPGGFFP